MTDRPAAVADAERPLDVGPATADAPNGGKRLPWSRRGVDLGTAAVVAAVGLAFLAPLRGLFRSPGPPMEEGFMLVFPELVLGGQVPHDDFLHLYGPGSLWALAGWYRVFGTTITVERVFGAAQLVAIVFGVMALARPWGRRVALASGLLGVLLTTTAIGLTALAWNGAVALAVASLWVALRARRWLVEAPVGAGAEAEGAGAEAERRADRLLLAAGLLAGLALLFRPDVVVAVVLGALAAGAGLSWARRRRWLVGAAVGLAPYLVLMATAGPVDAVEGLFLDPVFKLRDGRSLPRPPTWNEFDGALSKLALFEEVPWALPAPASPSQVTLWFFLLPAVALFVAAVGWWRVRAEPGSWRPRVLLAVGLFGLGLMPQAIQRPDSTHLAWVSCVPVAFLPVAVAEALSHVRFRPARRWATTIAAVGVAVIPLAVIPHFTARTWTDLVRQGVGNESSVYRVTNGDRHFYLGSIPTGEATQRMVSDIDAEMRPGERLLVGSADLRKTPYSDAYLYHLLPDLVPATRYIEMDPGMANRADSGLAEEVAGSDWLVLSHIWDAWNEPNGSRDFGSDAPNDVVRRDFCRFGDYDPYFEVYRRCEDS